MFTETTIGEHGLQLAQKHLDMLFFLQDFKKILLDKNEGLLMPFFQINLNSLPGYRMIPHRYPNAAI